MVKYIMALAVLGLSSVMSQTPTPLLKDLVDPTKMVDWNKAKRVIPFDANGIVKSRTLTIPNADYDYRTAVTVRSTIEPVVKKVGDHWEITFK